MKMLGLLLLLFPFSLSAKEVLLTLNGRTFHLEVAQKPREHQRGLSGRTNIPEDGGMLFVFKTSEIRQFYMYNCLVPIDLIYLDSEGKVIDFYEMEVEHVPQEHLKRYFSSKPAQYAIELKGGMLKTLGLQIGEKLRL